MQSVMGVVISKVVEGVETICIPMALSVSTDAEEQGIPEVDAVTMQIYVPISELANGREQANAKILTILEGYRAHFSGSGFIKLRDSVEEYLLKYDLSVYGKNHIPDPASLTRH